MKNTATDQTAYSDTHSAALALGIRPGITAVIGGGGKTTLLKLLADELTCHKDVIQKRTPKVILCTSTHILPFRDYPCIETSPDTDTDSAARKQAETAARISDAFQDSPVICVGTPEKSEEMGLIKYIAPAVPFARLAKLADYVLVEADGSRNRPFKAHAGHEPVIPENAGRVIYVAGAFGFMQPVRDAVHRPELFIRQMHVDPDSVLTPELAAAHICRENLADVCCLFCPSEESEGRAPHPEMPDLIARFERSLSIPLVKLNMPW